MANMGVERLILVAPQCQLTEEAKQGAVHAQSVLQNAKIYKNHQDFIAHEGEGIRIALSGRDGSLMSPEVLSDVYRELSADREHPIHQDGKALYLIFGPEDDGLANEEMELCHHVCRLPTWGEITSLNLSHAVLLTLYMTRAELLKTPRNSPAPEKPIATEGVYHPTESIRRWLEVLGFDLSARRVNIEKTLNRILLSRSPTSDELRIVDSVLQQTIRKLSGSKKESKKGPERAE
jgi:TrmH family RNA methyltransferase